MAENRVEGPYGNSREYVVRAGLKIAADVIVADGDRLLYLQRSNKTTICPGSWSFPGGHYKTKDCSLMTAAQRELTQELGNQIVIDLTGRIIALRFNALPPLRQPHCTFVLEGVCQANPDRITLSDEHTDYAWIKKDIMPDNPFPGTAETLEMYHQERPGLIINFQEVAIGMLGLAQGRRQSLNLARYQPNLVVGLNRLRFFEPIG
jgi:8-oxo-dGTP pyrophosphatase MutT (NUDIX family)